MDQLTFIAQVTQGRLPPATRRVVAEAIAKLEGRVVVITVAKFVRRRSSNQNRFMHGPFFKAMRSAHTEAGEVLTLDEVKELFKKSFGLRSTIRSIDGTEVEILKSTKDYTTTECEEAMEKARAFYAQYDQHLPFPHEDAV